MRSETNKNRLLIIIAAGVILLIVWQIVSWSIYGYIYYSNMQIVEVTVLKRSKSKLKPEITLLLSDDYYNLAFYVYTEEFGAMRTDIDTFDNIGRGYEKFTITRKWGEPEWWIIRDWTAPQPVPTWEGWDQPDPTETHDY